MGRLYQLFGFFSVICVYYYVWKQCGGLRFRKAIPLALIITFIFITIHFKHISNPLLVYAAIGVIGIPAITYGLLYNYEILLIIAAIYIPHNAILPADFGGIQQALNGTNIVLIALLLGMFSSGSKGQSRYSSKSPANVFLLIFMGTVFLSFIRGSLFFGADYYKNIIFDFKRFITPMILFLIFVRTIPDRETIKILVSVLMIVVIMAIFLGLLEWVDLGFGTYSTFKRRLGGLNLQANNFGAFIAYYVCLFLSQTLINFRKFEAKLLLFPFLLGLRILIPTNSRGAWISFPPALITVAFFQNKLLFIGTVFFLIVPFMINPGLIPDTIQHRFEDASKLEKTSAIYEAGPGIGFLGESKSISMRIRWKLLNTGLKVWQQNIFLGHGYGTFIHMVRTYSGGQVRGSAHNGWLKMLVEMGLISLVSLFIVFVYFLRQAYYIYKREKDLFLKGFALGFMGIIPDILVANLTGQRFNHVDLLAIFWMLSACIVKLKNIINQERLEMGLL